MIRKLTSTILCLAVICSFDAAATLPTAAEIELAFTFPSNVCCNVESLRVQIKSLAHRVEDHVDRYGLNGQSEWDATTNLFLRICALHFPTNDYQTYNRCCREVSLLLNSFHERSACSDEFRDLVVNQIQSWPYFDYPPKPNVLVNAGLGATTGGSLVYRDPDLDALSREYRRKSRYVTELNRSQESVRHCLIWLAHSGMLRKAVSMSSEVWTDYTNSVTTAAGLTRRERECLFEDIRP